MYLFGGYSIRSELNVLKSLASIKIQKLFINLNIPNCDLAKEGEGNRIKTERDLLKFSSVDFDVKYFSWIQS